MTARNGVTIPAANTATDTITINADARGAVRLLARRPGRPREGRNGVTVSAAPTDAAARASARSTFFYCDTDGGPCVPSIQIGATQTVAGARHLLGQLGNTGLTDGHSYAVAAVATDNVGHTTPSAANTVIVDNSAPDGRGRGADRRLGRRGSQYYDAPSKTLWLKADGQPARSSSRANAADPDSGIASVELPRASSARARIERSSAPYASSILQLLVAVGAGRRRRSPRRTASPTPAAATSTDSITVDVDGAAPATNTDSSRSTTAPTTTRPGTGSRLHGTRQGICGTVADAASGIAARCSSRSRTATTGKYYDGAAFAQATQTPLLTATLAGTNWSYALDQSKLTAPHVYERRGLRDRQRRQRRDAPRRSASPTATTSARRATTLSLTPRATHALLSRRRRRATTTSSTARRSAAAASSSTSTRPTRAASTR